MRSLYVAVLLALAFPLSAASLAGCTADITPTASAGAGSGAGGGTTTASTGSTSSGGGASSTGTPATQVVAAGTQAKGGKYQMVFTLGQPSPNAGASKSSQYQVQGGLIGATQSPP